LASDNECFVEDEMRVTKNEESTFKFFRTVTASEITKEMEETNGRVVLAAVNGVQFPKQEFSIENCTSEDFMKDELISKYSFETKTDENKYPQTASWSELQQKKKI